MRQLIDVIDVSLSHQCISLSLSLLNHWKHIFRWGFTKIYIYIYMFLAVNIPCCSSQISCPEGVEDSPGSKYNCDGNWMLWKTSWMLQHERQLNCLTIYESKKETLLLKFSRFFHAHMHGKKHNSAKYKWTENEYISIILLSDIL